MGHLCPPTEGSRGPARDRVRRRIPLNAADAAVDCSALAIVPVRNPDFPLLRNTQPYKAHPPRYKYIPAWSENAMQPVHLVLLQRGDLYVRGRASLLRRASARMRRTVRTHRGHCPSAALLIPSPVSLTWSRPQLRSRRCQSPQVLRCCAGMETFASTAPRRAAPEPRTGGRRIPPRDQRGEEFVPLLVRQCLAAQTNDDVLGFGQVFALGPLLSPRAIRRTPGLEVDGGSRGRRLGRWSRDKRSDQSLRRREDFLF